MEQEKEMLQALKNRDEAFIKQFCQVGSYLGGPNGEIVHGVCKQASVSEVLNFLHIHDAKLLQVLKNKV